MDSEKKRYISLFTLQKSVWLCLVTDNAQIALFSLIIGSDDSKQTTTLTLWDDVAKKYHDLIQEDEQILIRGFQTVQRNRFQSSTLPFVIRLYGPTANIQIVPRSKVIPTNRFSFVKIKELQVLPAGTIIDVVGIIATVQSVRQITTASGIS